MDNSLIKSMASAASGMRAQSFRLRIAAENLSNADTHGYKRKQVFFQDTFDAASKANAVKIGDVNLDYSEGELLFDPEHPLARSDGFVEMSNVDMMLEIADTREATRSYEANLTTFKQATQMYRSLIDLLR